MNTMLAMKIAFNFHYHYHFHFHFHCLLFFSSLTLFLPFIFLEFLYTLLIIVSQDSLKDQLKPLVVVATNYFDFLENYFTKAIHKYFVMVPIGQGYKVLGECKVRIPIQLGKRQVTIHQILVVEVRKNSHCSLIFDLPFLVFWKK